MIIPILTLAAAAAAQPPLTIAEARGSLVGRWQGRLEYRDYQSDRWFPLPVKVEVRDGGDGVTVIRIADFDDGPTGTVRITTVSMLAADAAHETSATFRKGREVELARAALSLSAAAAKDDWTLVESIESKDGDRPATLRYTTVRNGDSLVTVKAVDFQDDAESEWIVRNRTTLTRVRD